MQFSVEYWKFDFTSHLTPLLERTTLSLLTGSGHGCLCLQQPLILQVRRHENDYEGLTLNYWDSCLLSLSRELSIFSVSDFILFYFLSGSQTPPVHSRVFVKHTDRQIPAFDLLCLRARPQPELEIYCFQIVCLSRSYLNDTLRDFLRCDVNVKG